MGLFETQVRGAGFGQRRFLVRERGAISEAQLISLRPAINEYPDSFPLVAEFARPGRRGGSRPRGDTPGGSDVTGSIYPPDRPRIGSVTGGGGSTTGAISGTGSGSIIAGPAPCDFQVGGSHQRRSQNLAAGGTESGVTLAFPGPVLIEAISWWGDGTEPNTLVNTVVRVGSDSGVATTGNESGDNALGDDSNLKNLLPISVLQTIYPGVIIRRAICVVKIWHVNGDAVVHDFYTSVSYRRLQ